MYVKKYLEYDATVYNVPMLCTEMLALQRCIQWIVCIHTYVCRQYNTQCTYVIIFRKLLHMTQILLITLCDKQNLMIQFNLEKSLQCTLFTSSSNFKTTSITTRSSDHCGTYGQLWKLVPPGSNNSCKSTQHIKSSVMHIRTSMVLNGIHYPYRKPHTSRICGFPMASRHTHMPCVNQFIHWVIHNGMPIIGLT